jgi:hypothetical protein
MKSSMMALAVGAALAGCSTGGDGNVFAARDKTVEYYRVFDIKTDPGNPAVVKAATEGISKHVADATLATPGTSGQLADQPGRFKLAESSGGVPPGVAPGGPSCEGAVWTAKAAPRVNGGDNMNMVACLFPYKNGYHLDMYAVFTEKEGGWLEWPRRFTGRLMGTPESWTDQTMVDVVKSIRDSTGAQVALVEAKPALAGTPWLEMGPSKATPGPAGAAPASSPAGAPDGGTGGTTTAGSTTSAGGTTSAGTTSAGTTSAGTTSAGTTTAGSVTSSPAPSAANGIAPIAGTPPASTTETPASTVATSGNESKETKTDVK